MREFETGATRNTDTNKADFDGFLSAPAVLRFGEYMHEHRVQKDGTLRDSDNWQKGIPLDAYRKSLLRHTLHAWAIGRGKVVIDPDTGTYADLESVLCAIIFNAQGWLHELLTDTREAGNGHTSSDDLGPDLVHRVDEYTPEPEDFDTERRKWEQ